ncbi:glycosyltransferase family 4 protein [Salinarimonas sp.]|uniref:glycosyltransferase family 4 protein n=1 Tax=Salinarimonas sp. TaxID=2766526 RepID=UPI00391CB5B1
MTSRHRVLLIAEAANPEWVSVPLVGWSLACALREVADVHVVTHVRNRDAILRAGWVEGRDFTAIDNEILAAPAWRVASALRLGEGKSWTLLQAASAIAYPLFEREVWRLFGERLRGGGFDLVHRITPLSPTIPSPIAARCARLGIPFVIGPLNGGLPWPREFERERWREGEWLSYLRGGMRLLPWRRATLRAAALIVGSRATRAEMPARARARCVTIPENAVDPERFARRARPCGSGPLRACFVGRLVPYKGLDMLLEAAAPLARAGRLVLDIVGEGPMRPRIEALVAREGLGESVRLHGFLPHARVRDVLAQSEVFAFPSIREFGGGAVVEAMALGLVPIVVDYGGPGELVTAETGIKLPLADHASLTHALREALARAQADRLDLVARGARARARVLALLTWRRKAEQIVEVYRWALRERADRPVFFEEEAPAAVFAPERDAPAPALGTRVAGGPA